MMFSGASNNQFTGGTFNVNVQGTTAGAMFMYQKEIVTDRNPVSIT
jgi:hypothetical protein